MMPHRIHFPFLSLIETDKKKYFTLLLQNTLYFFASNEKTVYRLHSALGYIHLQIERYIETANKSVPNIQLTNPTKLIANK